MSTVSSKSTIPAIFLPSEFLVRCAPIAKSAAVYVTPKVLDVGSTAVADCFASILVYPAAI